MKKRTQCRIDDNFLKANLHMSNKELAAHFGCNPQAVKYRLWKLRITRSYEHFRGIHARAPRRRTDEALFWSKVRRGASDTCWEWTGLVLSNRRGQVGYRGKRYQSHRLAYLLAVGEIPNGLCVCHKCDNSLCCNPSHLFLGTVYDNIADCVAKGRNRNGTKRGEENWRAKLTAAQVAEIRAIFSGYSGEYTVLAKRYGVTKSCIGSIVRRHSWRHV